MGSHRLVGQLLGGRHDGRVEEPLMWLLNHPSTRRRPWALMDHCCSWFVVLVVGVHYGWWWIGITVPRCGVLASWASSFGSQFRCGMLGLTVGVPHQPYAGGAVGINSC